MDESTDRVQTDGALPTEQTFEFRAPAPLRATAIAAGAAVSGAVVIALSSHPVPRAIGGILLGFGALLAVAALVLVRRLRTTVRLDASSLTVTRAGRTGALDWSDVDKVQESGHQLIVLARNEQRDLVIAVPGRRGPTYANLLVALKRRLDASRGYAG